MPENRKDDIDWSRVRWTVMPPKPDAKATPPLPVEKTPSADDVAEAVLKKLQKRDDWTFWLIVVALAIWWFGTRVLTF